MQVPRQELTPDFRFELDRSARWTGGGRGLCGGDPLRLFRFSARGADVVRLLAAGRSIADVRGEAGTDPTTVAERLVDAGVLHPRPDAGPYTVDDVTVVVPVRDRAALLARLLSRLKPSGVRIVVVDDGSTDGSGDVGRSAGAVVIRRSSAGGPAAARNMGLRQVETPVVAFIDSDCLPEADWLEWLLPQFADPRVAAVTPRVHGDPADGSNAVARYDSAASALDLGTRAAAVRAGTRVAYVPAAVLLARRTALEDVGGFDERLPTGEDVDLVWRLADAGWTVRYAPSVVVAHEARSAPKEMLARRFAYGTSAAPLARRHHGRLAPLRAPAWSLAAWAPFAIRRLPLPVRALASAGVLVVAADTLAARLGTPLPFRRSSVAPQPFEERQNRGPRFRRSSVTTAVTQERQNPATRFRRSSRTGVVRQERQNDVGLVATLVVRAHLGTLRSLGDAVLRPYAPLALAAALRSGTARRALLAAATARVAIGWWPRRRQIDPAAFAALRLADDFAYSAGVWWGCAVHRTIEPLVPRVSWGTGRP